jgi:hypothetical protein
MIARYTAKERRAGGAPLGPRDKAIATVLRESSKPLSAYDLINLLRDQGAIELSPNLGDGLIGQAAATLG